MPPFRNNKQIRGHDTDDVPELFPAQTGSLEVLGSDPSITDVLNTQAIVRQSVDDRVVRAARLYQNGEGTPATWYSSLENDAIGKTSFTMIDLESESINISLCKYINLPIWIDGDLTVEVDEETTLDTLRGSAQSFPGFVPKLGDMFLYEYEKGKVGIFKIYTAPLRIGYLKETAFTFDIILVHNFTSAYFKKLEDRVAKTLHFNKKGYDENKSFLTTHENVLATRWLERQLKKLDAMYVDFYDHEICSLRLPGSPFYPSLVEFYRSCVSTHVDKLYVELPQRDMILTKWKYSVYAGIQEESWCSNFYKGVQRKILSYPPHSALMTSMSGKEYYENIQETDIEIDPLFTYVDVTNPITDIDNLVAGFINNKTINPNVLRTQILYAYSAPAGFKFYVVPILIYLAKQAIRYIAMGETAKLDAVTSTNKYSFGFVSEDLVDGHLLVPFEQSNLHFVISPDGEEYVIPEEDRIDNGDGTTTIDIAEIMEDNAVEDTTGRWFVMATNPIELIVNYENI